MYIHNLIESTSSNGPGRRAGVWFAGCSLKCHGCWNAETHRHGGGKYVTVEDLAQQILSIDGIEGVTFSGGEPIQQAPSLARLVERLKTARPDFSIGMYTGYTEKELDEGSFEWHVSPMVFPGSPILWKIIKRHLDFAVMGRYNQLQRTSELSLRGSANQKVVFFSDRYNEASLKPQYVEITIAPGGVTKLTGFPIGIQDQVTKGLSGQ
jgi:anaerobic ribonucleoside-triphosphate reductase activating protein